MQKVFVDNVNIETKKIFVSNTTTQKEDGASDDIIKTAENASRSDVVDDNYDEDEDNGCPSVRRFVRSAEFHWCILFVVVLGGVISGVEVS